MLNSIVLLDGIESAIQGVLWAVLAVFFVMVILSWLAASREWRKEEDPTEQSGDHGNVQE